MPKIAYEPKRFAPKTLEVIEQANDIIATYAAQGYDLTLRQLYYQFVSRDLIANKQSEYKRLGSIVSDARRAGLIDWNAITDRTRNLRSLGTWESPESIVSVVAEQFRYDRWLAQPKYVEVWFEKDALMGVFERVANELRLPFFSCRGYTSDSEVWGAAQRLKRILRGDDGLFTGTDIPPHPRDVVVLHFGDHDPSGIDMTRDIRDRLLLFGAYSVERGKAERFVEVRRLALNMDQVEEYDPPPNPAKETDSRFNGYSAEYGDESWELDALEPTVLARLVREETDTLIDRDAWNEMRRREATARAQLKAISDCYDDVVEEFAADIDVQLDDDAEEEAIDA